MKLEVPELITARLRIRPFEQGDLHQVFQLLDLELEGADPDDKGRMEARRRWLEWTVLSYSEFAQLHQPPYGDRAVTLRESGEIIGACGFAPCLAPFEQLGRESQYGTSYTAEVGLYYAISPRYRRKGYASEAARALVEFGFSELNLRRIVATTTYDNQGSMGVMRQLGMRIERNLFKEPAWFQVVGILDKKEEG